MPLFKHKDTGKKFNAVRKREGWEISAPDVFRTVDPKVFVNTFEPAEPAAVEDPAFNKDFFSDMHKTRRERRKSA